MAAIHAGGLGHRRDPAVRGRPLRSARPRGSHRTLVRQRLLDPGLRARRLAMLGRGPRPRRIRPARLAMLRGGMRSLVRRDAGLERARAVGSPDSLPLAGRPRLSRLSAAVHGGVPLPVGVHRGGALLRGTARATRDHRERRGAAEPRGALPGHRGHQPSSRGPGCGPWPTLSSTCRWPCSPSPASGRIRDPAGRSGTSAARESTSRGSDAGTLPAADPYSTGKVASSATAERPGT